VVVKYKGFLDRLMLAQMTEAMLHEWFWPVERVSSDCPTWSVGIGPRQCERASGRIWAVHAGRLRNKGKLALGIKIAWQTTNPRFVYMPTPEPRLWTPDDPWVDAIKEAIDWLALLMDGMDVRYSVPPSKVVQ
jgi:hypothetical protein